ncbi:MAG: replication/repair protein RecF [Gammaproteobacteria bacterium]|jgi:DNA replication and repair protein RecF|nr:replication/repair protein RecF [Gammaproteobacteria bacterium]
MSLIELTVEDLRCLQRAELALDSRRNLIWGSNGSGKTSLLEAIFLLGRGRSFRTRNSERLIRHAQPRLTVFGRTDEVPGQAVGVQVSRTGGTTARINGATAGSLTELSQAFPVQVIDPGVHKLVEEGGFRRRRWMDWAVFHVEPGFADCWVRYARAVKQRNAALRHQPAQAYVWDPEVARLGELIAASRRNMLDELQPLWRRAVTALSGLEVELHYSRGWSQDVPLAEALTDSRLRDESKGQTHSGPHRADVLLRLGGRPAREVLSRGQQKLVAIAMTLAQIQLLQDRTSLAPTLLLDDPAAELDGPHLLRFIEEVSHLNCQLVVTSLQPQSDLFGTPERVFHVEQGRVGPV